MPALWSLTFHSTSISLYTSSYGHRTRSVLLLAGLGLDPCAASPGAGRHGRGASSGTHHSLAPAKDRRRGATQCPSHLGEFLPCVSLEKYFRCSLDRITRLRQRPAKKFTA